MNLVSGARRATMIGVGAATVALVAALAASASAAVSTGDVPRATCGWTPANNSNVDAGFTADGVNIHTGNDVGCPVIGEGYQGQTIVIHCAWSGNGYYWFYITDETTDVTGWAVQNYVTPSSLPTAVIGC